MKNKRSTSELKRLVEQAIVDECNLPRKGLYLCVDEVEAIGRPPERIRVWAILHFLAEGSPFCCGEPGCHLGLFGERLERVGSRVRHAMKLRQNITLEFVGGISTQYHEGVQFVTDK
jgi:hypothetical protein